MRQAPLIAFCLLMLAGTAAAASPPRMPSARQLASAKPAAPKPAAPVTGFT